jgi:hypothetical protein
MWGSVCARGLRVSETRIISHVRRRLPASLLPVCPSTRLASGSIALLCSMATRTIDEKYPGTAVERMLAARERATSLSETDLSGEWESVRQKILWAAGLRDLKNVQPGRGYTGHAFNDSNHCDATTMLGEVAHNLNDDGPGRVAGIAIGNRLGPGIEAASLPELGEGGTWSTCTNGCNLDPPQVHADSPTLGPPRMSRLRHLPTRRMWPTSSSDPALRSSSYGAHQRLTALCWSTTTASS